LALAAALVALEAADLALDMAAVLLALMADILEAILAFMCLTVFFIRITARFADLAGILYITLRKNIFININIFIT
jgi:hypothetical protein